jgi:hypothetical protein
MLDLLRKAARTLDRGGDPCHRDWLSFNEVDYEERIEMKEIMEFPSFLSDVQLAICLN